MALTYSPHAPRRRAATCIGLRRGSKKGDNLRNARNAHDLAPDVDRLRFDEAGFWDINDGEVSRIEEKAANPVADAGIPVITHNLAPVIDPGDLRQVGTWRIEGSEGAAIEEEATYPVARIRVVADDLTADIDPDREGLDPTWRIDGGEGPMIEEKAVSMAQIVLVNFILAHNLAAGIDGGGGVGGARNTEEGDGIRGIVGGGKRPEHHA
jgi:hypothetical protein